MQLQFENGFVLWGLWGVAAWIGFQIYLRLVRPESASWRRGILSTTIFALLLFALARPQLGRQMMQKRALKGNLFIAMDVSRSMAAEDTPPNRIAFAVAYATRVVKKLTGTKFALFPFADTGYVMMPLTSDTHVAEEMLSVLGPGVTTSQSTDLDTSLRALFTTIQRMQDTARERGEDWAPTQVLLLSDGETHNKVSSSVLAYYRKERIPVFSVVCGTRQGGSITIGNDSTFRVPSSQRVVTKADPESMEAISRGTGGEAFPAELNSADRAAQRISQAMAMGRLSATFKVEREFYPVLLLLALLALTLDLFFGRWRSALRRQVAAAVLLFAFVSVPAHAEQIEDNPGLSRAADPERRAVEAYNQGIKLVDKDLKKAMELMQEGATLTKDKTLKKKALLALGNSYLKMMEPQQALQNYQMARDLTTGREKFETDINARLSENMELAMEMHQQMQAMAKEESDKQKKSKGEDDGKQKQDPKGPQRDYDNQPFSGDEKEKMFDLMGTEDQGIQARLMQEKSKKDAKNSSGKPW